MARTAPSDHQPHALSADDTLVLWRCDEALATSSFVDAGADAVTLVDAGTPDVAPGLINDSVTVGARVFDGATTYGLAAAHTPTHETWFQWQWTATRPVGGTLYDGGITVEAWIKTTSLAAQQAIVEFGEYSSPETEATNQQLRFGVETSGALRVLWEQGAGVNVIATSDAGVVVVGTTHHVAAVIDDDPDNFDKRRVTFYVDGEQVGDPLTNLTPPTGGTTARWIIGASAGGGSAVGTPGLHFSGTIDDVRVSKFAAQPQLIRADYARGIRDFDEFTLSTLPFTEHHVRVWLEDKYGSIADGVAGTMVDMTTAFGWNWVIEGTIDEDADSQTSTATVKLVGRIGELNLSPFAKPYADPISFAPTYLSPWNSTTGLYSSVFIGEMRKIWIEVATVPWGTGRAGAAPYYRQFFNGYVKAPSVSDDGRFITLVCQDQGVALQDVWIEPDEDGNDRIYGTSGGTAVEGQLQDIIDYNDPSVYRCISVDDTGGGGKLLLTMFSTTTGVGQGKPHLLEVGDLFKIQGTLGWDGIYTVGAVTANTVTSVEVVAAGAVETDIPLFLLRSKTYLGGKQVLWVDTSPAWNVRQWCTPATQNVMTALEEPMAELGWKVGHRWDDHRQAYRLSTWRPGFGSAGILDANRLIKMGRFSIDALWPRNVIVVEYETSGSTGTSGERLRRVVSSTTPSTATLFGRRYARVAVGASSNINASGEAQELADNIAADLTASVGDIDVDVLWDWRTEVGDTVAVEGEQGQTAIAISRWIMPQWMTVDTNFGCRGVTRSFKDGAAKTTIKGRTSSGATRVERHFDLLQGNGWVKGKGTLAPVTPNAPGVSGLDLGGAVRGVWVTFQLPVNALNRMWDLMEVHISTSNGFTPSSSTLKGTTRGENMMIAGLVASTTYYVKLIARDKANNVSDASSQTSFTSPA